MPDLRAGSVARFLVNIGGFLLVLKKFVEKFPKCCLDLYLICQKLTAVLPDLLNYTSFLLKFQCKIIQTLTSFY